MLLLAEQSLVPEEENYKKDMVRSLGLGYSKMIFELLTKILAFYMSFSPIDNRKSSFQNLSHRPLVNTIGIGVLASKTVLRMCWRLFFKYLTIINTARVVELETKLETEGLEDFSSSSISLFMREGA